MTVWFITSSLAAPPQERIPSPSAPILFGPDLPLVSTDRVVWTSNELQASFAPVGAVPVRAEPVVGGVRFPRAWMGADLEYRWIAGGFEDLVTFHARPAVEELTYDLAVGNAAGLRLVDDSLELLDAGGAPRLRVRPPFVVDAAGRHGATLDVRGCAVDRSPVAPWGRQVVAPGAEHCTVVVRWSGVSYPATVDPAWVNGGLLVTPRNSHAAARMADGRVLVTGGYDAPVTNNYTDNAEIYDPTTGTWAATLSMNHARGHHGSALLPDGTVLVAMGDDVQDASAEIYDPVTATWADTVSMQKFREFAEAVALPDGRVLAAGGCTAYTVGCNAVTDTAEIYDPSLGTWTLTVDTLSSSRAWFAMAALDDSRAVVAGGCTAFAAGTFTCASFTDESDVFDPLTESWSPTPDLPYAVDFHQAVRLADGRVLLAGGLDGVGASYAKRAALFDPVTSSWSLTASTSHEHKQAGIGQLPDGGAVIAGSWGTLAGGFLAIGAKTETFDPTTETWTVQSSLAEGRGETSVTVLLDGRVLFAGGAGGTPTFDHEVDNGEIFDQGCDDPDKDQACADVDLCDGFDDRLDIDADAVPDGCDNCEFDANADQADGEGDGIGDSCDVCPDPADPTDSDDDGVCDGVDRCAAFDDRDDDDADGVPSGCDVCPLDADPEQLDADLDGIGDICDVCPDPSDPIDSDGDGFCDLVDLCPDADDLDDQDADGQPDDCDPCPRDLLDDSDGDGSCDGDDVCDGVDDFGPDSDADGWPDACDLCPDVASGQLDFDRDTFGNECDCAQGDADRFPGATEHCDGVDEDCDGAVDNDPVDPTEWYRDADGDGQGDPESTVIACAQPDGYVQFPDDCDDVHADARIGGTEVCNGYDDDCDGVVDPEVLCPVAESPTCGCAEGGASGWNAASALAALALVRRRRGSDTPGSADARNRTITGGR